MEAVESGMGGVILTGYNDSFSANFVILFFYIVFLPFHIVFLPSISFFSPTLVGFSFIFVPLLRYFHSSFSIFKHFSFCHSFPIFLSHFFS